MSTVETSVPVVLLISVGVLIVAVALISVLRSRGHKEITRYRSRSQKYVPGAFSSQMELDLRLPYRRFRQLYPDSKLTYEEYKRLQMQRAFRRSMSSQENKRMVR